MAVNLATKYSSQLDQIFTHGSYTEEFINTKYKFDGVKTINVLTATTVAPTDYSRTATGDRFGGNNEVQDTVATYTLTHDKAFKMVIDNGNLKQGAYAKRAAEVLKAQMNEQIIPMIDKDRIATATTGAATVSQAITATADAYADFLSAQAFLDEAEAPIAGRVVYVTPAYYNSIKAEIVKNANADSYNSKLLGKGYVGELDGVPVVKVPTSYFPAKTKMVTFHKDALLGAKQITKTTIKTDSELVDGAVIFGRFIFGTFVLDAKKKAVASVVTGS